MQPQTPIYRPPVPKPVSVNTAHVGRNYEVITKATRAMRDYVTQGAQTAESLATLRRERKYDTMVVAHSAPNLSASTSGGYLQNDPASTTKQLAIIESHNAMARPVNLSRSFRRLDFPWKSPGANLESQRESSGLMLQATSPCRRAAAMVKALPRTPIAHPPEPVEPALIPSRLLLATQAEQERLAVREIKAEAARQPRQSACFLSQSKRTDFSRDPTGSSHENDDVKRNPRKCSRARDDDGVNVSCSFFSPDLSGRDSLGCMSPLCTQPMASQSRVTAEGSRSTIGKYQQAGRSALPSRSTRSAYSGSRSSSRHESGQLVTRRDYTFGAGASTAAAAVLKHVEGLSQHNPQTNCVAPDDSGVCIADDDSSPSLLSPQQSLRRRAALQPVTYACSANSAAAHDFFNAALPGSSGPLGNCSRFIEVWQREHDLYAPSRPHTATGASGEMKRFRTITRPPVRRTPTRRAS